MTTFALVHGGWGAPQEWDGVARALEALGHRCIPIDLPIARADAGLDEYAAAVVSQTAHVAEPVVVVGHSAGGYVAALVPSRRPVAHVAYLAAFVPEPGRPLVIRRAGDTVASATDGDIALANPTFRALVVDRGDGTSTLDLDRLAFFFAGEAADAIVGLLAPLVRPQGLRAFEEPWPLPALPSVPSSYLLALRDPVLPPASQRLLAARLGVAPIELDGDHGVHIKRPRQVAAALVAAIG